MIPTDAVILAARKLIEFCESPSWHFGGDFGDFDECGENGIEDIRWPKEFRELRRVLKIHDKAIRKIFQCREPEAPGQISILEAIAEAESK